MGTPVEGVALLSQLPPVVLAILVVMVVIWSGVLLGAVKWLLSRYHESLEKRDVQILDSIAKISSAQEKTDKCVADLEKELVRDYVRREDWIRGWVTVEAKLDAVYARIDEVKEKVYEQRN
ncbi:MAG: hypothetical protein SWH61_05380 [Thermodesulfobacteriota bacterium]|nr:hypothetical protein [Thermodesulfobacteriota bacterium]